MIGYVKPDPEDIDILVNKKSAWLLEKRLCPERLPAALKSARG